MSPPVEEPSANPPGTAPEDFRAAGTAVDLILDMELPVLVRFGTTQMALRDLMETVPGTLIEFNRAPDSPVEIVVNGRVVARGAAVAVHGNYGVRITEITVERDRFDLSSEFGSAFHVERKPV